MNKEYALCVGNNYPGTDAELTAASPHRLYTRAL